MPEAVDKPTGRPRGLLRTPGLAAAMQLVTDLVLPPLCLACHQPLAQHDALCARCWASVDFIRPPLCDVLGIPLPFDSGNGTTISAAAVADPPAYDRARAAAHFHGVVRDLVHGFKYADRHDGRRLMARWLEMAGAELLADADLIVPVPLHRWRLLRRRFNQAALLAHTLSRSTGIAWEPGALQRVKATPQQVGMTRDQRQRNMAAAFTVPSAMVSRLDGRNVVLVDDVITTGATAEACARALKAAGARRVDVLAVAIVVPGTFAD